MFRVDDDETAETPHIIPGGTNDSGKGMTFSEHLTTKHPSDLDSDADDSSDESDDDEATPKPLI